MRVELQVIAQDCEHSGLFPAPGGGKIRHAPPYLYVTYGDQAGGSLVLRFDGARWTAGARLPIKPPYLALDARGFLHVAGLHQDRRSEVWYFRYRRC